MIETYFWFVVYLCVSTDKFNWMCFYKCRLSTRRILLIKFSQHLNKFSQVVQYEAYIIYLTVLFGYAVTFFLVFWIKCVYLILTMLSDQN